MSSLEDLASAQIDSITRAALAGKKEGCEVMGPAEDRVSEVNHVADIYRLRKVSD